MSCDTKTTRYACSPHPLLTLRRRHLHARARLARRVHAAGARAPGTVTPRASESDEGVDALLASVAAGPGGHVPRTSALGSSPIPDIHAQVKMSVRDSGSSAMVRGMVCAM